MSRKKENFFIDFSLLLYQYNVMPKKYNYTKKTGRPTKYNAINLSQLETLILRGFTDKEISSFFGITETTLNNYKKSKPDFFESLKNWKIEADANVEKSLYQRAIGYEYDEVTYEKTDVGGLGVKLSRGEVEQIKHVDTYKTKVVVKQVVPDVTAQIFWLKNRKPTEWRDKTEVEVTEVKLSKEEINARVSRQKKALSI